MDAESVKDSVVVEDGAADRLRAAYGLPEGRRLRLAFVAGPGDAAGTFDHWLAGRFDPRVPVVTYSSQLYTLVERIDAEALILCEPERLPAGSHPSIRFVRTPRRRDGLGRVGFRIEAARFARRVLREVRAFEPDVVVASGDAPFAVLRGLPPRSRAVLSLHNAFWPMGRRPTSPRGRLKQALAARALRRASASVSTSAECRDQLVALTRRAEGAFVEVPQVLARHAGAARPRDAARRILFLGRIEAYKGVLDLVRAFDGVAEGRPDVTLAIAGTGSAEGALRQAIGEARHADRIAYLGQLSADKVHDALERSDLLVCPSRSDSGEGLALVVVEAAVHGVPSLLSSVVPAKDLFPNAVAEFPADDVAALRAALDRLVSSPDAYRALCRALGERSGVFFDRSLSWGSQLYKALLAAAR